MSDNKIALVDKNDNLNGFEHKDIVHKKGLLHRAFSLFVFNDNDELLLQKRARIKYHSPRLWTNTCCSHLIENCSFEEYIHQRLKYEMGFDCDIEFRFSFHYQVDFPNGLSENEIDHVYFGKWNGIPTPNPNEAESFNWMKWKDIVIDVQQNPDKYTYWFIKVVQNILADKIMVGL